jgi:hypothetical protein
VSIKSTFVHSCERRFIVPIRRYTRNRMQPPRIKKKKMNAVCQKNVTCNKCTVSKHLDRRLMLHPVQVRTTSVTANCNCPRLVIRFGDGPVHKRSAVWQVAYLGYNSASKRQSCFCVKLTEHYAMKVCGGGGEWMYRTTFSWPRHWLEVSGQLHALAALLSVKEPPAPIG